MMRFLVAACLLAVAPLRAEPAPDATGAMAAAEAVMTAIGAKDAAALKALILPQAVLVSQRYAADGTVTTAVRSRDEWLAGLIGVTATLSEKLVAPRLLIRHDIAQVWSPYTFDLDGKRSHCGIDSLGLARIDGQWRITSLTWTAEPQGCPQ